MYNIPILIIFKIKESIFIIVKLRSSSSSEKMLGSGSENSSLLLTPGLNPGVSAEYWHVKSVGLKILALMYCLMTYNLSNLKRLDRKFWKQVYSWPYTSSELHGESGSAREQSINRQS